MTDETSEVDEEPVKKKKKKKKNRKPINKKKAGLFSFIALIGILYYWGTMPIYIQGSQLFGVCRVYIELYVQYPSELRFIDIRERGPEVAVEYITYDSFGQHITHRGICQYKRDENKQIVLDYFHLRRGVNNREYIFAIEDPERVSEFNKTIPFLLQQPLNLIIRGPARTLGSLSPVN